MQLVTDPWSDADLDRLAALERAQSALEAERATVLARMNAVTDAREFGWAGQAPWASLLLEVAGTCRVSKVTAGSRLDDATHLVQRLPATHAAFAAGELYAPQVRVLVQETRDASADVCAEVERRVLPVAARLAPADLRRRVQRAVLVADPATAQERHEEAQEQRRTWVRPETDGMAVQGALLTATQGRRFDADLTALVGRTTVSAEDGRTAEQRRADLLADLPGLTLELLDRLDGVLPPLGLPSVVVRYLPTTPTPRGAAPRRRRRRTTQVVVVPVCSALGLSREPVWLDGHGWITAEQGLALLSDAELRKACVDAGTGRLVAVEEPVTPRTHDLRAAHPAPPNHEALPAAVHAALRRMVMAPTVVRPDDPSRVVHDEHDPTDAQRELVDLRDEACDGIGCTVPASAADLDHHVPWPGGPTTAANLRARSERCHGAKHHGWTVTVDEHGVSSWTSPRGRQYVRLPRYEPPPTACRPSTVRLRRLRLQSARAGREDAPAA